MTKEIRGVLMQRCHLSFANRRETAQMGMVHGVNQEYRNGQEPCTDSLAGEMMEQDLAVLANQQRYVNHVVA